jgi:thioredoxin reductase (NADPH)
VRNATIDGIVGNKMVEKARVRHVDGRVEELPCAGVFAYIGLEPCTEFLSDGVARDERGFVRTDGGLETTIPGVFAIGAVRSGFGGTLDNAMDEARRVAEMVRSRVT